MALTPAAVLRLLAAIVRADGDGELPALAIHLTGGQVLDGYLVRVDADQGHEVAVLAGRATDRLTYALTADVIAVTVHDPERFQDALTAGALPRPSTGPPPSRLALRRDFAPTADFPLRLDWEGLPDSGDALANLARLLRSLREASDEIRADELGRRAWVQIRTLLVEHQPGRQLAVERRPDGLAVVADLAAALPRQLTGVLRGQLNALL